MRDMVRKREKGEGGRGLGYKRTSQRNWEVNTGCFGYLNALIFPVTYILVDNGTILDGNSHYSHY